MWKGRSPSSRARNDEIRMPLLRQKHYGGQANDERDQNHSRVKRVGFSDGSSLPQTRSTQRRSGKPQAKNEDVAIQAERWATKNELAAKERKKRKGILSYGF